MAPTRVTRRQRVVGALLVLVLAAGAGTGAAAQPRSLAASATPPPTPAAPEFAATTPAAVSSASAPSLTVVLDTDPDAAQDFNFTSCRLATGCGTFTLDDDPDSATPPSATASDLAPGAYTVTQAATGHWTVTDLVCDSGETIDLANRTATIELEPSEIVRCTFTDRSPTITITEDASPIGTGTGFTFSGCQGSGCASFTLGDERDPNRPRRITAAGLAPGSYTVTQDLIPNWTLTGITCDTGEDTSPQDRQVVITLSATEHTECHFTNVSPSITLEENARPDDPHDFGFTTCLGDDCGRVVLDNDQDPTLPRSVRATPLATGTYTITQDPSANWPLTSISCHPFQPTRDLANRRVTISVGPTTAITCEFTNRAATLTVVQESVPDDPHDFTFAGCQGAACGTFHLDDDADPTLPRSATATALPAGTYTITQSAADPELTALVCTGDEVVDLTQRRATVTLDPGEQRTCTFTNGRPSLTIVQDTQPDDPQDFAFTGCLENAGCSGFTLDDDADPGTPNTYSALGLAPGAYTIEQHAVAGYALGRVRCTGFAGENWFPWARGVTVSVGADSPMTCTFTDTPSGPPLDHVTHLDGDEQRTCAVTSPGGLWCWGAGGLGDGTSGSSDVARPVPDPGGGGPVADAEQVSAGRYRTCYRRTGGQVRCWGTGVLGDGTDASSLTPVTVSAPSGGGPLTDAVDVAVGESHACAVLAGGQARCWGVNDHAQLGDGTRTTRYRPVVVSDPTGTGPLTDVVQIDAGRYHTCARLGSGQVRCWGAGPLGDGSATTGIDALRPVVVSDPAGGGPLTGVVEIASGRSHVCARTLDAQASCWGVGTSGQLGDGGTANATRPVVVSNPEGSGPLTDAAGLALGVAHSCARLSSGELRCWGEAYKGQLGNNSTASAPVTRPVTVLDATGSGPLTDIAVVGAGALHTCAALGDGTARCWGHNFYGQLGTGNNHGTSLPAEVLATP